MTGSALTARERKSMMIKASDLIAKFQQALDEHWGYIYGKTHEMWSEDKQKAYAKKYAKDPDRANSVKYGSKWAGHWVTDCSGLFDWAFDELGGDIAHGSNSIWDRGCTERHPYGILSIPAGAAVFTSTETKDGTKHNHIGLHIGGEIVIEAQGCQAGVTTSSLYAEKWTDWALLKSVDYSEEGKMLPIATVVLPTGASGNSVNMREKPSKDSPIVGKVPVGQNVVVAEDLGAWCRIKYFRTGYMMSNYLEYENQGGESSVDEVEVPAAELEAIYDKIGGWLGKRG